MDRDGLLPPKVNSNRKCFMLLLGIVISLFLLNFKNLDWMETYSRYGTEIRSIPLGYLVYSENCQIEDLSPFDEYTMKYFTKQSYKKCIAKPALAEVNYDNKSEKYVLSIKNSLKKAYGKNLECCYHKIYRPPYDLDADDRVSLGSCWNVTSTVELKVTTENIIVRCFNKQKKINVYVDGFAMMPEKEDIQRRLTKWQENDHPISVLMLGIDSVSRLNLIRAMPKTRAFLNLNNWFEMAGYNKIEDNTFPNLMAILTGYNTSKILNECDPENGKKLGDCPFIWKEFQNEGYVTAFAEDAANLSTFNYLREGFAEYPTDFYLRPFILEGEQILPIVKQSGLPFCLGYNHEGEYVFNYGIELTERFKSNPYFGFLWANTFSHNNLSDTSSMDDRIVQYLRKFQSSNSVIFFFSDHGMRFGPSRGSPLGYYEERLPFMFIYLPKTLREKYPYLEKNLMINKNRLTNPYDIHMTLQTLLKMSTGRQVKTADGCPNCQSLFEQVPNNRACEDIAIEDHWCMCHKYEAQSTKQKLAEYLGNFMISHINNFVANYKSGNFTDVCYKLSLGSIDEFKVNNKLSLYRIKFTSNPNGSQFEATIYHSPGNVPETVVRGVISRLNIYKFDSICVKDLAMKKYCSCKNKE